MKKPIAILSLTNSSSIEILEIDTYEDLVTVRLMGEVEVCDLIDSQRFKAFGTVYDLNEFIRTNY